MGYWATHTFIRTTNTAALEQAVQQVLVLDEYESIAKPTPEESFYRRASGYSEQSYLREEFCGVMLIPTTSRDQQWSYIQCAPDPLLSKRARGIEHPRLAELAKILQVDAFRLEVEDGDSVVLLECNSNGEYRVSGALTSMLEEAYDDYPDEDDGDETTEPSLKYFEEEVQGDDPAFEILSDLKPFSPENRSPEHAARAIEAEFFGSVDMNLNWNRLFNAEPINDTDSTVRELYFRRKNQ